MEDLAHFESLVRVLLRVKRRAQRRDGGDPAADADRDCHSCRRSGASPSGLVRPGPDPAGRPAWTGRPRLEAGRELSTTWHVFPTQHD